MQSKVFFTAVLFSLLSSCNSSLQDLCQNKYGLFESQVRSTIASLKDQRTLASAQGKSATQSERIPRPELAEWAHQWLSFTEKSADLVSNYPELRRATPLLLNVSNHLVAFYGYAMQGNSHQMLLRLEQIEENASRAQKIACSKAAE